MRYDPEIHRRRSIRLANFDYSTPGAYFVTICTHHGACLFGAIRDAEMFANEAARMIQRWWKELTFKYPRVNPDQHIVMPNHFHGIEIIEGDPIPTGPVLPTLRLPLGAALRGGPRTSDCATTHATTEPAPPLADIVGWFKTMTTNEYIRGVKTLGWPRFDGHLWQRDYYERVIRSEEELLKVREYVGSNPAKWEDDPNHPSNIARAGAAHQ